jgi:cobalt transport protein ATP-binding subunit
VSATLSPEDPEWDVVLDDVMFSYDSGVDALKGVNLRITRGDYVAIIGGNGSGKTTLAKHLNGLLRPNHGTVTIRGSDAAGETVATLSKMVGYVFQNPDHQLFCSSVEEEVAFGPENQGLSPEEIRRRVDEAIAFMGLESLRHKPPLSASLGDRRRISIASVISMAPGILILDEPTTGLDSKETRGLMGCVDKLNRMGTTILLITHEIKLVAEHARRVVVLHDGSVVQDTDARNAFSDLGVLRRCNLLPPPVTLLAHRLAKFGISPTVNTAEALASEIGG